MWERSKHLPGEAYDPQSKIAYDKPAWAACVAWGQCASVRPWRGLSTWNVARLTAADEPEAKPVEPPSTDPVRSTRDEWRSILRLHCRNLPRPMRSGRAAAKHGAGNHSRRGTVLPGPRGIRGNQKRVVEVVEQSAGRSSSESWTRDRAMWTSNRQQQEAGRRNRPRSGVRLTAKCGRSTA